MRSRLGLRAVGAVLLWAATLGTAHAGGWDASLADSPRHGGEGDDAPRIQRLIDANPWGTVYLPKGEYLVATPLVVTNACSIEMNKGAVLKAVAQMPFVLTVENFPAYAAKRARKEPNRDYGLFVRGGCVDGNGMASCMSLVRFHHYTLRDMVFLNGRAFGLRVSEKSDNSYELIADNLYFKCTQSGLAGNVALYTTGGDSHYTDCVVVDYTVGFRSRGGSNRFTRCHVWGGPIPPARPGELPEMLKDSVCYWVGDSDTLRDCYADTGETGFRITGDVGMFGCWYFSNKSFHLDNITIIDHQRGRLLVSGCRFSKDAKNVRVYAAKSPFARVTWRDNTYKAFPKSEQFGAADWQADASFDQYDQECAHADDWELLQGGAYALSAQPGEFEKAPDCRIDWRYVSTRNLLRRFPECGAGGELVIRCRATAPATKKAEVVFIHEDGKCWGLDVPLTTEWRDVGMPVSQLRYFSHWGGVPPDAEGETLSRRKLRAIRITYGKWLCPDTTAAAHGFEISSIKIVK